MLKAYLEYSEILMRDHLLLMEFEEKAYLNIPIRTITTFKY